MVCDMTRKSPRNSANLVSVRASAAAIWAAISLRLGVSSMTEDWGPSLSRSAGEGLWARRTSNRAVALDGDPVARAGVRPIIPHRVVLDAAVVPEGDRVLAPAEAALEQRVGHVLVEVAQDAVALVARDAVDVAGEALVDVERFLAGHRVGAHDRVVGIGVALLVFDPEIGVLAAIMLAVVPRGQPVEIELHAVRQRVIGGVHAGEEGVAALGRALADVEDAAHRRLGVARDIGVPAVAV